MRRRTNPLAPPGIFIVGVVAVGVVVLASGCGSAQTSRQRAAPHPTAYWNRSRFLRATPFGPAAARQPNGTDNQSHPAGSSIAALRVGAIFDHSAEGNHFCTASVVDSPGEDLLITAAHCIDNGTDQNGLDNDIVFVPGYVNGNAPFGIWTPAKLIVPKAWSRSSDPDYDFGFIILNSHNGENIEKILGANKLTVSPNEPVPVHVTGYPASTDGPISCVNAAEPFGEAQLEFKCEGYSTGTSGSPWVTHFDHVTRTGDVVGVIGGYQRGGDTDDVSYSVKFGPSVMALYRKAVSEERVLSTGKRRNRVTPPTSVSPSTSSG